MFGGDDWSSGGGGGGGIALPSGWVCPKAADEVSRASAATRTLRFISLSMSAPRDINAEGGRTRPRSSLHFGNDAGEERRVWSEPAGGFGDIHDPELGPSRAAPMIETERTRHVERLSARAEQGLPERRLGGAEGYGFQAATVS